MKIFYAACVAVAASLLIQATQADAGINNTAAAVKSSNNLNKVTEPSTVALLAAGVSGFAARKIMKKARD